jgi:hypothetical protein
MGHVSNPISKPRKLEWLLGLSFLILKIWYHYLELEDNIRAFLKHIL